MSETLRHNGLVIILDGLGDRPSAALGGKTPLEAAHTPNMNRLAAAGQLGQVDPLAPGVPVGTHTGAGILMGLAPAHARGLSRGPVEAAGAGLTLRPGDVALRCNFATLKPTGDGFTIIDRRAARIREGTGELAAALAGMDLGENVVATLRPATHHRAVLRLSGPGLSAAISDTDPGGANGNPVAASFPLHAGDQACDRTARIINRFVAQAYTILSDHPVNRQRAADGQLAANGVITRGAGSVADMNNIVSMAGLKTALITGGGTVAGLGHLFSFTVVRNPRFTAAVDTDLAAKMAAVAQALKDHDLVYLHVKAPDICAHDRDPVAKKAFIERFDDALMALEISDTVVAVSADHSTDCNTGNHSGDPVPTILYAPGGRRDSNEQFGELHCMSGGLGRITGYNLINLVLDNMGCLHNFRAGEQAVGNTAGSNS